MTLETAAEHEEIFDLNHSFETTESQKNNTRQTTD